MSAASVIVERVNRVLLISIDRPHARNAVDRDVTLGLAAAIEELETDPELRIGVLTGRGGTFSSGMDLKAFLRGEEVTIEGRGLGGFTTRPPDKPLIAAVEGWALAGGFEMALACDLIVASSDATFGLPEVKRGLAAVGGGLLRLPRVLPRAIAMELALTGDTIDASRAHALGMVNVLTGPGGAVEAALDLAERIAANAPLGLWASKAIVSSAGERPFMDEFAAQDEYSTVFFASEDAQEGARAFAEKRQPRWLGR